MVRPKRFDARRASLRAAAPAVSGYHGLALFRGGMIAAARAAMALSGVEGAVGGDAGDLLIGRDLVEHLGQHGRIAHVAAVNSAARISSVCSSIPIWILRQTRRFVPPCLRVCRENSPPDCFLILLITIVGPTATLAGRRSLPDHIRIEPDRQRAAALERFVIGRPVQGLAGGGGGCSCRSATMLDSQDESLTRFVQQSQADPARQVP